MVKNNFRIEDRSKSPVAKVLGYTHIVTRYLVMAGEPDDYIGILYRGTKQQCESWLRTMLHQKKLKVNIT